MRFGLLLAITCASLAFAQNETSAKPDPAASMEETWGVRIEALRSTAGGYMLDFRTRVINAEKARPLFSRAAHPELIDEMTGAKVTVPRPPKLGSLRFSGEPMEGRVYAMLFGNPGKYVKPGRKVTIVIGDFKAEHLTVE